MCICLQDLIPTVQEGEKRMKNLKELAATTSKQSGTLGQQTIDREMQTLLDGWTVYSKTVGEANQMLENAVTEWTQYEELHTELVNFLNDTELVLKTIELKSTIDEKTIQLEQLTVLESALCGKGREVEELSNQDVRLSPKDSKSTSQVVSKYNALKASVHREIEVWQGYVDEHSLFIQDYDSCITWLHGLSDDLQKCKTNGNDDRDNIEEYQLQIKELLMNKDGGVSNIHKVTEEGEQLYPHTFSSGREIIRHNISQLKEKWQSLTDQLATAQIDIDRSLQNMCSYDESYSNFNEWLNEIEVQQKSSIDYKTNLKDKKIHLEKQISTNKDILSHQHSIDTLCEQLMTMSQNAPRLRKNEELVKRYQLMCRLSEQLVSKYQTSVSDHQRYHNECQEWKELIEILKNKLHSITESAGDKYKIQIKVDEINDMFCNQKANEEKLLDICSLNELTQKTTGMSGKEELKRQLDAMRQEWKQLIRYA